MNTNRLLISIVVLLAIVLHAHAQEKRHEPLMVGRAHTGTERIAQPTLDQESDTLRWDDGEPYYVFRYPDVYNDDFRNQYFVMPEDAMIAGVMFGFATVSHERYSSGDPDLVTILWETNGDSLPGEEWQRDTTVFADYGNQIYDLNEDWTGEYNQFVIVNLRDHGWDKNAYDTIHVGYSAILNSPDDSLAILSDDATTSWQSSEWYDGEFHFMWEAWRGVNFLIRVIIETSEGVELLSGGAVVEERSLLRAYPNPFNSQTRLAVRLMKPGYFSLEAYDILGRHVETIYRGYAAAEEASVFLNADSWTSGSYYIQLTTQHEQVIRRIFLEK
ncbi:T9SS type A sorting domain-containing protein [bacterium]|nr:T9SS type A sorting domain-containing protein [bacterium]